MMIGYLPFNSTQSESHIIVTNVLIMIIITSGDLLASTSGDGTVKLWNLSQSMSTLTLSDHRQPGMLLVKCCIIY